MRSVTELSQQVSKTIVKSISGLALVSVFLFAPANGIRVEGKVRPEAQSAQKATSQEQEFYIEVPTDERDRLGLSTLVVAGSYHFMFDCGPVRGGTAPPAVTALFLTHLDRTTADGIDQARSNACTAPPVRIWGPPGTREWMLQTVGDRASEDWQRRPVTVIDAQEGVVSEMGT